MPVKSSFQGGQIQAWSQTYHEARRDRGAARKRVVQPNLPNN